MNLGESAARIEADAYVFRVGLAATPSLLVRFVEESPEAREIAESQRHRYTSYFLLGRIAALAAGHEDSATAHPHDIAISAYLVMLASFEGERELLGVALDLAIDLPGVWWAPRVARLLASQTAASGSDSTSGALGRLGLAADTVTRETSMLRSAWLPTELSWQVAGVRKLKRPASVAVSSDWGDMGSPAQITRINAGFTSESAEQTVEDFACV